MADQERLLDSALASSVSDISLNRPYHSKRPHKKSRKGCKNCKVRKVKCDECRPSCRSCTMRKAICVYPSETSSPHLRPPSPLPTSLPSPSSYAASPPNYAVLSPYSSTKPPCPQTVAATIVYEPMFRPTPSVDELDMKLLWFYTAKTSYSFSVEADSQPDVGNIMQNIIVQQAFANHFLMDSILALSSLHLQSLKQPIDPGRALAYRVQSLEGYRMAIQDAKPETYASLLANSLLLTAISSHSFRDPDGQHLYLLEWMTVWRGISLIFNLIPRTSFKKLGLGALFHRPTIDFDDAATAIPNSLLFMISAIKEDDPDFAHAQTYYETLKYLGSLYINLRNGFNPIMNLRIITWLTFLPKVFTDLSQEKRTRALVILAHYSIFLKIIQDVWWYDGIGSRSIRDICKHVSSEWQPYLKAPLMAMHIDDKVGLARILLDDPSWDPPGLPFDTNQLTHVDDDGRKIQYIEGVGPVFMDSNDTHEISRCGV